VLRRKAVRLSHALRARALVDTVLRFCNNYHDWYDSKRRFFLWRRMAYFKDLTRYEYSKCPFKCAGELYNVGWLEQER
jgi:hypothetical protein